MDNVDNAKDEISTVITVTKSEDKPVEPDPTTPGNGEEPPTGNDNTLAPAPEPAPTAAPVSSSTVPNTGDVTSITGYLVSGALSLVGIVGINRKKRK